MLDPTLPLTVIEWEEWGDPIARRRGVRLDPGLHPLRERRPSTPYPAILATAGLNDPRVGYHEPTKWVARLRDRSADATGDDRPVLLKVEMGAGHGGPSGRYDVWKDEAFVLAFVLDRARRRRPDELTAALRRGGCSRRGRRRAGRPLGRDLEVVDGADDDVVVAGRR